MNNGFIFVFTISKGYYTYIYILCIFGGYMYIYIYNCIDSFWYDEYLDLVVYIYIYITSWSPDF